MFSWHNLHVIWSITEKDHLPVILRNSALKRIFGVCNEHENTYPCSRAKLLMVDIATTAVLVPLCTSKNRASDTLQNQIKATSCYRLAVSLHFNTTILVLTRQKKKSVRP